MTEQLIFTIVIYENALLNHNEFNVLGINFQEAYNKSIKLLKEIKKDAKNPEKPRILSLTEFAPLTEVQT